ncbi:endodeoxyribonuclease [Saxophila tyrrhenica]|uniref:DNA topoisomerase (ATP-hydrolyzing) n=1 Tax=Saxophila tyrrhenica TaxID=1690608 RepID=A0AAV9P5R4_9PEZI|nr:endodeoxyribonuclease [Saxophila tyrrhenica]
MDDEDFEDLFAEADLLQGSSQESLTAQLTDVNVLDRIEEVFERVLEASSTKDELAIELQRRPRTNRPVLGHRPDAGRGHVRFPGKTAEEAWRFTVVVRILELIHETLRTGAVISKRDVYYRDPALFGSQTQVDRYVDDIAYTFSVPRASLNIAAAAKGLLAGAVSFCRRDGSICSASTDREGMLIAALRELLSCDVSKVKWILVIEKEATFRSIAASEFWDTVATDGVIVTGKGYPDIATRAMVRYMSTPSPQNGFMAPPVYGLVDHDPDGLAILSVYKSGSIALAHEGEDLLVPRLQWLGLRREQFLAEENLLIPNQALLTLTTRDRRRAIKMLERCDDPGMRTALQSMLVMHTKAELQILDSNPGGMTNLLRSALGYDGC